MARQVQIIKGTTEQNDAFTGVEGALTYDTETKNLRIHDGTTEGGFEIPSSAMGDYVIYWDSADSTDHSHAKPGVSTPTNHGWYRYYKSGWVEQGGYVSYTGSWVQTHSDSVVLPIEFANTDYRIMIGRTLPTKGNILTSFDINKTTTGFGISSYAVNQSTAVASNWFAVGMSAQGSN